MDGSVDTRGQGRSVEPTNKELNQLNQFAGDGEKLLAKMDAHHRGFVTPEELYTASKDTHLTVGERKTAAEMYKLQEEIRYQRIGYLPSLEMPAPSPGERPTPAAGGTGAALGEGAGGAVTAKDVPEAARMGRTAAAAGQAAIESLHGGGQPHGGKDISGSAQPTAETMGAAAAMVGIAVAGIPGIPADDAARPPRDQSSQITSADMKAFHKDVQEAMVGKDIKRIGVEAVAGDIMSKYGDHGKLDHAHLEKGLAALSAKKSLTSLEKDDYAVLTTLHDRHKMTGAAAARLDRAGEEQMAAMLKREDVFSLKALTQEVNSAADQRLQKADVAQSAHLLNHPVTRVGGAAQGRPPAQAQAVVH